MIAYSSALVVEISRRKHVREEEHGRCDGGTFELARGFGHYYGGPS